MGQNWLEDYMKFKNGITPLGIALYPLIVVIVGFIIVGMYLSKLTYWIRDSFKKKRR